MPTHTHPKTSHWRCYWSLQNPSFTHTQFCIVFLHTNLTHCIWRVGCETTGRLCELCPRVGFWTGLLLLSYVPLSINCSCRFQCSIRIFDRGYRVKFLPQRYSMTHLCATKSLKLICNHIHINGPNSESNNRRVNSHSDYNWVHNQLMIFLSISIVLIFLSVVLNLWIAGLFWQG